MMEYYQLTINDYLSMKRALGEELLGVSRSFVRIGYKLRVIAESEIYRQDGYASIAEFAQKEYGLSKSSVSRFMAINKKYSVGGFGEELLPEYAGIEQSKLSEMLSLPDSDLQMIQPEAQRSDIRDLKAFNVGPAPEIREDLTEFFREFLQTHPEETQEAFSGGIEGKDGGELSEIFCPSGSLSFRKNGFFAFFYENRISVKRFGEDPKEYSWGEFKEIIRNMEPEIEPEKEPEKPLQTAENKDFLTVAPAQQESEKETEEDPEEEENQPEEVEKVKGEIDELPEAEEEDEEDRILEPVDGEAQNKGNQESNKVDIAPRNEFQQSDQKNDTERYRETERLREAAGVLLAWLTGSDCRDIVVDRLDPTRIRWTLMEDGEEVLHVG